VSKQSAESSQKESYTSRGTERLVSLAEGLLDNDTELGEIEQVLDRIGASRDDLSDAERQQIEELTQLLQTDPSRQGDVDKLAKPAEFQVSTASDRMSMHLTIRPAMAGGQDVSVDDVLQWLSDQEVTRGVDREAIEQTVNEAAEGRKVEDAVIVRGARPTEGTAERVIVCARRSMDADPAEFDPADLSSEGQAGMCVEGDVILKKIPAQPGEPGFTATGQTIDPPPPDTINITAGPNVEMHGQQCIAKVGGLVIYGGGRIEVRRMLVIDKDVTGNQEAVHFDGDIHVRAAIRSGARVVATGNLTVDGCVEAAYVESTGGDVELRHGAVGGHEGVVKAAGSITARFAENVTLMAGDDIIIDIGAMHSRLIAYRAIRLSRGRGQMVGGSAMAGEVIEIKQAGSSSGVRTELCVGLGRTAMQTMAQIDGQIARLQLKRDQAYEYAEKLRRTVGDPTHLKPDEVRTYTSLRQVQLVCDVKIRELRTKRDEVLADAAEQSGGHIDVAVSLMPEVVVHIGDAEMVVNKAQHRCRLTYDPAKQDLAVQSLR